MGLNGGPKRIVIGDESFALPSMHPSQTASVDGNVVVAEASGVYNVDGAVTTAGGGTVRASGMAVPVSTGSEGSAMVGSQAVAVPPANATRSLGGRAITSPDASVTTPRGIAGTSTTAGSSTAQGQGCKAQRATGGGWIWMLPSVVVTWGFTLPFSYIYIRHHHLRFHLCHSAVSDAGHLCSKRHEQTNETSLQARCDACEVY